MPKLTIRPSLDVIDVPSNKDFLTALREQDIYVKSSCGGHASCSDCIIKIVSGEDLLTPPTFDEIKLLGNVFHITKERLACQCKALGDVTIDLGDHDKASDAERLRKKSGQFLKTQVRKKTDVDKMYEERSQKREEKQAKDQKWERHWEKDPNDRGQKKLGGGRRPKPFISKDPEEPGESEEN
jgi:ferredoxin